MSNDMRDYGQSRRDKAVTMAMKRKEEYLGARVPKELRDSVVARAKEIGIPVSILIRNILEEAFSGHILESSIAKSSNNSKQAAGKFAAVIGWEKLELNRTIKCAGCGVELAQGTQAALGLGAAEPLVICDACKERL